MAPRARGRDRGGRPGRSVPGRRARGGVRPDRQPARAPWRPPSARSAPSTASWSAIVGGGPIAEAAAASAAANGATPQPQATFDTPCDALLVAGKAGVLEHDLAATVQAARRRRPHPVPVTARALAVLGRAGVVVVPDFLSTAAPVLTAVDPDGGDAMLRVHDAVADLAGEGTNLWMAAVTKAEAHLPHLAGRPALRTTPGLRLPPVII